MLYVSDLDGTLLNKQCQISDYSRQKLTQLIAKGLPFTIATARGIHSMKQILGDLPLNLPVICNNGAYIRNFQTREVLFQADFKPQIANGILSLIEDADMEAFVTSCKPNESEIISDEYLTHNLILNEGMKWFLHDVLRSNDPRLRSNVHYSSVVMHHKITCLTIIDTLTMVQDMQQKIMDKFGNFVQTHIMVNPYQAQYYWLTVQDIKATKGNAVKWLAEHLNIPLQQTCVFGDEVNDFSMFDMAGRKMAMKDAIEGLKQKATQIIGCHNEDGVLRFIENDFLVEISEK